MGILVVDVGTSGLRAAVVREDGSVNFLNYESCRPDTPASGLVEFDPQKMGDAVLRVCNATISQSKNSDKIEAVGITNQRASKFPDPIAINQQFKAAGMRLVANIKPCLLDDHPAYASVAARGGFIREASTGNPVVEPFWDGRGAYLDFTAPDDVAWWQAGLRTQILEKGIDAGWNDNNEYAIQSEQAQSAGWGQAMPLHRSRPLHGLLMTRATYEAQQSYGREHGRDEAVFTVTRAGPPGLQRYAQTWSGDNTTSWATLRWNFALACK